MADALDLGSSGRPCRFKSCYPHKQGLSRHFGCLGSPCFLRLTAILTATGEKGEKEKSVRDVFLMMAGYVIIKMNEGDYG